MPLFNRPYPVSQDAIVANLAMPQTNWGQLMAARDQQLQQQIYLTQQSEQELLQEQAARAQVEQFKQQLRSLPLERPDKMRVQRFLMDHEKGVAKRLKDDYSGNLSDFIKAEGATWMANTKQALENSEEYQTGLKNLEHVTYYKDALRKGESVVGDIRNVDGKLQRISAEQQMHDYISGKSPTYTFKGSYKDDNDLVKHFGEQWASNGQSPFFQTTVSEQDKLNHLLATNNKDVAWDKYLTRYKDRPIYYKTKPYDDYVDFKMKEENHKIQMRDADIRYAEHGNKVAMDKLQATNLAMRNQLLADKIAGTNNSHQTGDYLPHISSQSVVEPSISYYENDANKNLKVLPHSGYDLRSFGGAKRNAVNFKAYQLYDKQAQEALYSHLGIEKVPVSKENPTGWRGGKVLEGIIEKNGFNGIDLANTDHQIVHVEPKIYFNAREFDQQGKPISSEGPMAFVKATIQFKDNSEAKNIGLLSSLFGAATEIGVGAYNSDKKQLTVTAPIGYLDQLKNLGQYIGKQEVGQKAANNMSDPYAIGHGRPNYNPYMFAGDEYF